MPQTATPPQARAARDPQPRYEGLFREPVYPDGPYDQGDKDDDTEG